MKKTHVFLTLLSLNFVMIRTAKSENNQNFDAKESFFIRNIEVQGSKSMKAAVIGLFKKTKDNLYTAQDINSFSKNLESKGWFDKVKIELQGETLLIIVSKESPTINDVKFQGHKAFTNDDFKKIITIKPRTRYYASNVETDKNMLQMLYKQRGYHNARVKVLEVDHTHNRKDIIFEIEEGELFSIKNIIFIGNKTFSDTTLLRVIQSKIKKWYDFLSTNQDSTYDPEKLNYDAEKLTEFYHKEGYADMRVTALYGAIQPQNHGFVLTFAVEEGPRYCFGCPSFAGHAVSAQERALLQRKISWKEGDWFNERKLKRAAEKMTVLLNEKGHPFLEVKVSSVPSKTAGKNVKNPKKDVVFTIVQMPRQYVGDILITGNKMTNDDVIRRELNIKPGDALNATNLKISQRNIESLGFFEKVDIVRTGLNEEGKQDLNVKIKDTGTGEATLGAGYESSSGFVGRIGFNERNLLGRGYNFDIQTGISGRCFDASTDLTIPYFLNRKMDFSVGLDMSRLKEYTKGVNSIKNNNDQKKSYYKNNTYGINLRISYGLSKHLTQTLSYRLSYDNNTMPKRETPTTDAEEKKGLSLLIENNLHQTKNLIVSCFGHTLVYERLKGIAGEAIGGWFVKMNNRWSVAKKISALSTDIHFRKYHSFDEDGAFLLRLDATAGYILKLSNMRFSSQFFLGGRSLPGFCESGVGPQDLVTKDALGGRLVGTASAKFFFPTGVFPKDWPVRFVVHGTCGALGKSLFEKMRIRDEERVGQNAMALRASVGAGITMRLPMVGAFGLIFSKAVTKKPLDRKQTLLLVYGYEF